MVNDKITLGKYIGQKRQEIGLSQRQLAIDTNVSNSTISRIENDDGISPDNSTLKAIATRLNIDYNYLLALNKSIDDEPEIRVIQRAAKKMSDEDKKKMLDILRKNFDDMFNDESDE